tara:strand:+ start:2528 stop:2923 length:396 start_codon:yes stop_codon:yes gene_type:complete
MQRNTEECEIEKTTTVVERIPDLNDADAENAVSHHQLSWTHGFMNSHKDGQTTYLESCGVHLQKVTESVARCVAVVDHPYCFGTLGMMMLSFERAGIEIQVDPYTVVIPYDDEPEENEVRRTNAGDEVEVV